MTPRLESLLLRLGGSPERRSADGVVTAALLMTVVAGLYALLMSYPLSRPDRFPFLDGRVVEMAFAVQTRFVLPAWIGFLLLGLLARRRWPDGLALGHAVGQFLVVSFCFYAYLLGYYTTLYGALSLFTAAAIGVMLFDVRIVRAGILSFAVLVLVTTAAEQLGGIPYAPVFERAPFEEGRLSGIWLLFAGFNFFLLLGVSLLFVALVQLGREREQRLARATRLIRRYVAGQVAERILAGEQEEVLRPERLKLTIFFSDVVGFTAAADRMEAEDLTGLLNEYLSEMARIADAYGATLNQFVGDAIMIFFGAPEATHDRDHALRAVHMALEMQRRMVELGEKWFEAGIQSPFRIRIGINTGVASVGDYGSEGRTTYSAIGNQTNLAARIQDHCEPGRVLISHTTWALVNDEVRCEERGEIQVKGLHYPVRVYEVLDESAAH